MRPHLARCENNYAIPQANRNQAIATTAYTYRNDGDPRTSGPGFDVTLHPVRLAEEWRRKVGRWPCKKTKRIFVNSMSDLFHARGRVRRDRLVHGVPIGFVRDVFDVVRATPMHTFQLLTKRPERAVHLADQLDWPPNLSMGVSVETQEYVRRTDGPRCLPAPSGSPVLRAAARPARP